jgi:hypothetical protein
MKYIGTIDNSTKLTSHPTSGIALHVSKWGQRRDTSKKQATSLGMGMMMMLTKVNVKLLW